MTELLNRLPIELNNLVFSFVGKHPVAKLLEEHWEANDTEILCRYCDLYIAGNHTKYISDYNAYGGRCEYCWCEYLGCCEVYTCDDCGEKCYTYGRFTNTETGLFCSSCLPEEEEEEDNPNDYGN